MTTEPTAPTTDPGDPGAPAPLTPDGTPPGDPGETISEPGAPVPATVGQDPGDATFVGAVEPPTTTAGADPGVVTHDLPTTATGNAAAPSSVSTPHTDPVADEFAALEAAAAEAANAAPPADVVDPGEAPAVADVAADPYDGPNPAASDGKWGTIPGQGRYEPVETGVNP